MTRCASTRAHHPTRTRRAQPRAAAAVPQDQPYCVENGFKQEVLCSYRNNVSEAYVTFEGCPVAPGDFLGVVRFELLMMIFFVVSFSFSTKRKRRLAELQQHRIANYLNP